MNRMRIRDLVMLPAVLFSLASGLAADEPGGGSSRLALRLPRGICIDRQVRAIPPEPGMTIHPDDIRLVKSMGFGFVKLLVNPAVIQSTEGIDLARVEYFDRIVDLAARENLPAVVCIHPEDDFKRAVLGNAGRFESFFTLMQAFARHIAQRWTPRQVALQLMTEPYGSSDDRREWNHWDRLQRRLWQAIRRELPSHTLILSGDSFGSLEGLENIQPVDDDNVMYCFTFYEPFLFTFQGGNWRSDIVPGLHHVPYPSDAAILADMPRVLQSVPARGERPRRPKSSVTLASVGIARRWRRESRRRRPGGDSMTVVRYSGVPNSAATKRPLTPRTGASI